MAKCKRFYFIDDIVEGIVRCILKPVKYNDQDKSSAPYRIFNIGNNQPTNLLSFIEILEEELGQKAIKNFLPIQPGDVISTHADLTKLDNWIGFSPKTPLRVGVKKFVNWYKKYYFI